MCITCILKGYSNGGAPPVRPGFTFLTSPSTILCLKPLFAENLSDTSRIWTVFKQSVQFQIIQVHNGSTCEAPPVRRVRWQGGVDQRIQNPKEDAEVNRSNNATNSVSASKRRGCAPTCSLSALKSDLKTMKTMSVLYKKMGRREEFVFHFMKLHHYPCHYYYHTKQIKFSLSLS